MTGARTSGGACGSIRRNAKNLTWARNGVDRGGNIPSRKGCSIGAAWLSSARVVRCWVKSRNERNPRSQLPASNVGDSGKTAGAKPEEGGDDVKSSWSLRLGLHTCYNGRYSGELGSNAEPIPKAVLSSDCRLQPGGMKLESLVIVDQHRHGEYVPGPCTHRPSRHGSDERPKSVSEPARDQAAEGERRDWGEVVTR